MWKGAIQFGLVTIPVKLYLATESRAGVSFHMLHKEDLSRIQMKVFCPVDEEIIQRTVEATNGNKKEAAQVLGISRSALYAKLKRLDIEL